MTKRTKAQDSKAVAAARVELAAIVGDLKGIKARAVALARRLERAGKRAKPVGEMGGEPWTEERWLAAGIHADIDEGLESCITGFARDARGSGSDMLAAAIARSAKRSAKHEAEEKRLLDLLQEIKAGVAARRPPAPDVAEPCIPNDGVASLQGEFRTLAYNMGLARRTYLDGEGGDQAFVERLTYYGVSVADFELACGGRY